MTDWKTLVINFVALKTVEIIWELIHVIGGKNKNTSRMTTS